MSNTNNNNNNDLKSIVEAKIHVQILDLLYAKAREKIKQRDGMLVNS